MIATKTIKRPALRYHGGKWVLAPWIISYFPPHRVYVEPFGGAASVLLRKPRAYAEVYNDLDGEIVNLFRVLRNPSQARELVRLVKLTPYSREEFDQSYILADDPIEQARRTLFRSFAGYSSVGDRLIKVKPNAREGYRVTYVERREWQRYLTEDDWRWLQTVCDCAAVHTDTVLAEQAEQAATEAIVRVWSGICEIAGEMDRRMRRTTKAGKKARKRAAMRRMEVAG